MGFFSRLKKGLENYYDIHICAICDNDKQKYGERIDNVKIISPQDLSNIFFDKVFVCVGMRYFREIEQQLSDMGVPKEKVVTMITCTEYQEALFDRDPIRKKWMKEFANYTREVKMLGNIAECGVFCGETSMFLNKYWPERKLYLFDTFEGFCDEDIANDSSKFDSFGKSELIENPFKVCDSSQQIEIVKKRLIYSDNFEIHKGYFPESAKGIDDSFCFVNLDMDLYQPQLDGLKFFWDKMVGGGVILLHDYFHPNLPGVKRAIEDFEKELRCTLTKMPIGDECSMAIIKETLQQ